MVDTIYSDMPSFDNDDKSAEAVIAQVLEYETSSQVKSYLNRMSDIRQSVDQQDFEGLKIAVSSLITYRITSVERSLHRGNNEGIDSVLRTIQQDAALALVELNNMEGQNQTYTKDGTVIQTPIVRFLSREIKDRENNANRYETKGNNDRSKILKREGVILKQAYRQILGKKYSGKGKEA